MRKLKSAALSLLVLAVLAGCGPMPEPAPTATSEPTAVPPGDEAATPTPGTPAAGSLTLGRLADRVNAAWQDVESYRVTFTGTAPISPAGPGTAVANPAATPSATPISRPREPFTTVRDVELTDRQRQTVAGLGADDHEAIAVGDRLYVRGPVVERIAPGASPDQWIELDPTALPEGAMLLPLLGGLAELPGAPLANLPARLRDQDVRELETVQYDGRDCRVFAAADTVPATGMRVDFIIAIDGNDVPCFIETGAGGVVQGRDEYSDIGADFDIEPPTAATPVSIPAALATPIARD